MPNRLPLAALLLLSTMSLFAQQDSTLQLDVQIRARSEWRDGYKLAVAPDTDAELVTIQRSRLTLTGDWNQFMTNRLKREKKPNRANRTWPALKSQKSGPPPGQH